MIQVKIVTPDGLAFEHTCEEVVLPTTTGFIGVRTGHRALITLLKGGTVRLKNGSSSQSVKIDEGFAEVNPTSVSLIVRGTHS